MLQTCERCSPIKLAVAPHVTGSHVDVTTVREGQRRCMSKLDHSALPEVALAVVCVHFNHAGRVNINPLIGRGFFQSYRH